MKALIQKVKGEFPNLNFFQANLGFSELGYEIEYFEWDKTFGFNCNNKIMPKDWLKHGNVVVGGVPVVDNAYELLGVKNPYLASYPESLNLYLERAVGQISIASVRDRILEGGQPLFIKPKDAFRKQFNGHVVEDYKDLIRTAALPQATTVIYSEILKFKSEYRVFVHKNRVVGIKNYAGCIRYFPHFETIDGMVGAYKDEAPIAYALDVGIIGGRSGQRTCLVEVNDSNCLGCYGLSPITYAKMIADRWDEVMEITTLQVV